MDSVVFYAIRNKKHRYFVPYQNCSFGGVIVPKVMIDSGCNTLLLPLERGQIGLLAELFPFDSHTWRIGLSNGVGGKSAVLHIEAASISVCLSPTALPISVNALRFHLHPEDFGELLALVQAGKNVQGSEALATLGSSGVPKRRTHALVGQWILGKLLVVQKDPVMFAVHSPDWTTMERLINQVNFCGTQAAASFPSFDDLEDDDHAADDDTDFEDSAYEPVDDYDDGDDYFLD
eukprot:TRINITY_DN1610_c0_g1_i2.p1 TRINITY_DN1610_c0_g1~~TRINITY_DN1610_c0_g1_i2.p1  ORF type:complete len:234 (+),score=31.38 TRINITY_DN1610_c0_g1_i2:38-739(+)